VQHPLTPRYAWASLLYPYIKNLQIYQCPSNPNNGLTNTLVSFSFNVSYAVNVRIHPDSWLGVIRNEAYIQEPSQKIEFGECKAQGYYEIGSHWFLISSSPSSDPWRDVGFAGHNGTFNCTFADGHAKPLKPTATNAPFNMWGTYTDILSNTVPFCGDYYDPNCDEPSPGAAQGLQDLENAYN
jgi:prepilin-type processing-associated H-X9-DG protein